MKLLCLSTAEQGCSLAIVEGDAIVCEEFWEIKQTHSIRLFKMIEHMLEKRACLPLSDMDGFVVARGPGSFTGLRIGISVVKGLAYAMGKPAHGVSSLDGIAFRFAESSLPVCVMMDARRKEVYCAVYQFENGALVSKTREMVVSPEEAVEMANGPVLFAGSGSMAYQDIIGKTVDTPRLAHNFLNSVSAAALVRSLYQTDNFLEQSPDSLSPCYIRKSDAQLQFVEKPKLL